MKTADDKINRLLEILQFELTDKEYARLEKRNLNNKYLYVLAMTAESIERLNINPHTSFTKEQIELCKALGIRLMDESGNFRGAENIIDEIIEATLKIARPENGELIR